MMGSITWRWRSEARGTFCHHVITPLYLYISSPFSIYLSITK